ncbi:MAG: ABC transporter ATP-binding protein [Actinomycetota bacterium]|nr:ABC transporter ATP-binding protein [Actinomycetota bacterium]MDQ3679681.1 ABC transporter ATP-binding protein [Actinomycetota bacterium]
MTTTSIAWPETVPTARHPAVVIEGLTKRYGRRLAVDHLSFAVPAGTVAGFIGPNGAGKTTTMAMLLGLVRPTSGSGTVLGHRLDHPERFLGRVGALIEAPAFWPGLTGTENLRALAVLAGNDSGRIPELLELVGLSRRGADRYGEYSLGMKQRLGIAAALLGDPELLVLDEPTNGLDPVGMNEMRNLIARAAGEGRTVLVSSHLLSELEHVADWLVVIDKGSVVYQGPADRFLGEAEAVLTLAAEHEADAGHLAALVRSAGFDADRRGAELAVPLGAADPRSAAAVLNRAALDEGIVLVELHLRRATLESHYLTLVEGSLSSKEADR